MKPHHPALSAQTDPLPGWSPVWLRATVLLCGLRPMPVQCGSEGRSPTLGTCSVMLTTDSIHGF